MVIFFSPIPRKCGKDYHHEKKIARYQRYDTNFGKNRLEQVGRRGLVWATAYKNARELARARVEARFTIRERSASCNLQSQFHNNLW